MNRADECWTLSNIAAYSSKQGVEGDGISKRGIV